MQQYNWLILDQRNKMESYHIVKAALSIQQILLIVLVLVLLFGARKIPELMKGVGKGIKEFKNASQEDDDQEEQKK